MMVKPVCPKCGSDLDTKGEVFWCTKCIGWMAPNDVKFKVRHKPCGHWNPKDFHFCESCGQQLDDDYIVVAEQGRIKVFTTKEGDKRKTREERRKLLIKKEIEAKRKKGGNIQDEGGVTPPLHKKGELPSLHFNDFTLLIISCLVIIGFFVPSLYIPVFLGITILMLLSLDRIVKNYFKQNKMKKKKALPTSPTSKQSKYKSQYNCKNCGHLFWRDGYPELEVSRCQKCGASDLIRVATLEYVEPPETIQITEQEEPPPVSYLPTKYKSHFNCKACGYSFWVSEHRFKVPYCLNCGAPDPIHIVTVEQE